MCALADILYINATTSDMAFRAAIDARSLRMLSVSMPGTLSFGSILAGLGVTSAASMGDVMTVTATTVVYVPNVANVTGKYCSHWAATVPVACNAATC